MPAGRCATRPRRSRRRRRPTGSSPFSASCTPARHGRTETRRHEECAMSALRDVFVCDSVRTPIGRYGGALARVRTDDLAAVPIRALVERNAKVDWAALDEVVLGCANQAGEDNRNVARMAGLLAGLPDSVPGITVNRLCASGLDAVILAARAIAAGEGAVYVAGGVESMSRAPYALAKASKGFPFGNLTAYDTSLGWRFPNPKMEKL